MSLRAKLEHLAKTRGKRPEGLDGPRIPRAVWHVWEWFLELDRARPSGGMDPGRITFSEIKAWSELTGNKPRPHEIAMIRRLDDLRLKSMQSPESEE